MQLTKCGKSVVQSASESASLLWRLIDHGMPCHVIMAPGWRLVSKQEAKAGSRVGLGDGAASVAVGEGGGGGRLGGVCAGI